MAYRSAVASDNMVDATTHSRLTVSVSRSSGVRSLLHAPRPDAHPGRGNMHREDQSRQTRSSIRRCATSCISFQPPHLLAPLPFRRDETGLPAHKTHRGGASFGSVREPTGRFQQMAESESCHLHALPSTEQRSGKGKMIPGACTS